MITGIIVGFVASIFGIGIAEWLRSPRKAKNKAIKSKRSLSWPSRQIMKQYNNLPQDSQRVHGLENTLAAMDEKFGIENVNAHFRSYEFPNIREGKVTASFEPSEHSRMWHGRTCLDSGCKYSDYVQIRNDIRSVVKALENQAKAIKMSNLQPDLDNLKAIREAFMEEVKIIDGVTRDFT